MGLLSGLGKVDWGSVANGLGAAQSFFDGDFATGSGLLAYGAKQRSAAQKARDEEEQYKRLIGNLVQQGLTPEQAEIVANNAGNIGDFKEKPPAPDAFERTLSELNIDRQSPLGQELYRARATNMVQPAPSMVGSPERGYNYVRPPGSNVDWNMSPQRIPQAQEVAPGVRMTPPSLGGLPTVNTEEDYNALRPGQEYYDPQGRRRRKGVR